MNEKRSWNGGRDENNSVGNEKIVKKERRAIKSNENSNGKGDEQNAKLWGRLVKIYEEN